MCFRTGAAMCENAAECVTVSVTSVSGLVFTDQHCVGDSVE
jgi:hypothetical protein